MRITSHGAAENVTGSKHLVEINNHRILLDCGMFQGKREWAADRNKRLPFDVNAIHAVILGHAHIDHSGSLPMLAKMGYRGRVYTTPATRDLCEVMLLDSAKIQDRDARWLSKKHQTFVPPAYAEEDVREIMRHFVSFPYDMSFEVAPGVEATFRDAGHVLGSAMVDIQYRNNGTTRRFLYTGDIGRKNMPILRDPWEPDGADVVLMESTYGNRDHDPIETLDEKLTTRINRVYERGGKIIVPSFALERAQEFIFELKRLMAAKRIPELPVFVDSPLTVNVTEVFRLHTGLFDEATRKVMEEAGDPFELPRIRYIRSVEESMALNEIDEPAIIISASGMCEYGRILHHLRNNIGDAKNAVFIIGFQAKNTLGRRIVERERQVKIFGIKHDLMAEVKAFNSLSAHAGRQDLIDFGCRFRDKAERILLIHGENEALNSLKDGLAERGCDQVAIQQEGVPYEFDGL